MQISKSKLSKPTKATMGDVARHAGVSPATVARVIYKNGYVKEATRQLVEKAVRAIGYRPNMMARGLRTSRSFTLGMVVSESRLNTFPPVVAHVAQVEALKLGYSILTLNNHSDPGMEAAGTQRFLDHHVDAVIFGTAMDPENVWLIANSGTPVVQIEREVAKVGDLVAIDPTEGLRQAVDHLYALGHRLFAYIGGDLDSSRIEGPQSEAVELLREQHFIRNVERHGLKVAPGCVLKGPYYLEGHPSHQTGYNLMMQLMTRTPLPTAIICGSDLFAAAALQAIQESGFSVPRDFSIIGYDDTLAEFLTPPLTTIAQPANELGKLAVQMAISAIDKSSSDRSRLEVATRLVVRRSTAPPRTA